ncbi:MAG TPA: hypothetical protein VEU96_08590 [Bryobacteraceae bacterium]|nr:hypothetical protein [Bryobacteraceae bacterium]
MLFDFARELIRGRRCADDFFYDAAVEQGDAALGAAGVALIVGDHADGRAFFVRFALFRNRKRVSITYKN